MADEKEPPKARPKKKIVLRAAPKPDPYAPDEVGEGTAGHLTETPATPVARPVPSTSSHPTPGTELSPTRGERPSEAEGAPLLAPAAPGGVSLPPVIAAPRPDVERKRGRPLGLAISIVGGTIASFAPLLTWWRMSLSLLEGAALDDLPSRTGVRSIPGILCLAGGLTILLISILLTTKPLGRKARLDLGSVVMVAGILVAGAAVWAMSSTGGIDPLDGFVVSPQLAITITLLGGLIAVPGGYLLMREAQQAVTYVKPSED
ncbi:MAG: hypothetical protein WD004_01045 [Actinomycetota bacterium]